MNLFNPKISVVMSTHSRNKPDKFCDNQLKRALDALLAQTYTNFELHIVDDGSEDGTKETLWEYSNRDSRIKVTRFEESCKGFTTIRYNWLNRQSSNEFIIEAFDDEKMYPHWLETLINPFASDPDLMMCYAQGVPINARTGSRGIHGEPWSSKIYYSNIVPCGAVMRRKKMHDLIGYGDESAEFRRCSDYEFWVRVYYNNLKVKFIPVVVGEGYIQNSDSVGETIPVDLGYINKIIHQRYPRN